jgi:DNA primase
MRRNNDELTEALDQIDMESWLDREGVRYRKARGASGQQLNVKECPVCGNAKWKVFINAETGLGNCFHGDCEAKFNRWSFIKASLGTDNRGAVNHVKQVATEQGWRPPKTKGAPVDLSHADLKLPESIGLPHNGRNLKYLDNRSITPAIASYFQLRFSHRGRFDYLDDDGRPISQDYSNRIIIPVFDLAGSLVSFQGRDITGAADKKYLFPPGFASTGTHLYNGHNAIAAERVCVGEGVFDVAAIKIALDQEMDLRDVVPIGTFGKHLSAGDGDSQLAKFMTLKEKGLKQVTFLWDGEERAIDDAIDACLLLHGVGLVARLAILPLGKDPNEVPPDVVRKAFYAARVVTPATATRMRLRKRQATVAAV